MPLFCGCGHLPAGGDAPWRVRRLLSKCRRSVEVQCACLLRVWTLPLSVRTSQRFFPRGAGVPRLYRACPSIGTVLHRVLAGPLRGPPDLPRFCRVVGGPVWASVGFRRRWRCCARRLCGFPPSPAGVISPVTPPPKLQNQVLLRFSVMAEFFHLLVATSLSCSLASRFISVAPLPPIVYDKGFTTNGKVEALATR